MLKGVYLSILIALSGCAGYEFGDGTRAVLSFRQAYCQLPDNLKEAAHDRAKEVLAGYPEASWCEGVGFAIDVIGEI